MEDRLLPTHRLGYAIEQESKPLLMANGMDPRKMLNLAAENKPHIDVQANPMTLFEPLNQGGQGACFPAGTLITMHDGTLKNIEDVKFGESVVTHLGRARQIVDVMARLFTGDMYEVFVKGWGKLELTEDHVVRVMREGQLQWARADDLRDSDQMVIGNGPSLDPLKFVDLADYVSNLYEDGDRVAVKNTADWTDRYLPLDSLTCFVLGLYVAEGSTDRTCGGLPNRAVFTMHEDETLEHLEIEKFSNRFGAGFALQHRNESKGVHCRVASCIFARFVELVCGKFCNKKQVPPFIQTGSDEQKLAFLRGYYAGDGSRSKYDSGRTAASGNTVRCNQLHAATASRSLAQQVATMLVSIGMKPGRTITRQRNHQTHDSHQVYLYSKDAADFLGQDFVCLRKPRAKKVCDEGQLRPLRSISRRAVTNVEVYDITVDEDHSFLAGGLVVHNCQGHALAMMFTICYFLMTGRILQFSRGGAYYLSQRFDGIQGDRGSTLSGGQKVATQHGLCLESEWKYPSNYDPREPQGIDYKFKLVASQATQDWELIQEALDMGLPVQDGITWNNEVSRTICTNYTGSGGGGHSTTLWTKIAENYRRINSWGLWDGDGCNENTPKAMQQQVEHRNSSHVIYAPEGMIYPEVNPV